MRGIILHKHESSQRCFHNIDQAIQAGDEIIKLLISQEY